MIAESKIVTDGASMVDIVEVGNAVSKIREQGEHCIMPKQQYEERQFKEKGLGRFFTKASEAGAVSAIAKPD